MDLLQHVRAAAFAGSVQLLADSRWALQPPGVEVLPQTRPPGLQCQAILSPPRLFQHHTRAAQRVRKTSLPRQCKRSQPRVSSNLSLVIRGQPANLLQNDAEHVDVDRIVLKGVDPAFRHRMNAEMRRDDPVHSMTAVGVLQPPSIVAVLNCNHDAQGVCAFFHSNPVAGLNQVDAQLPCWRLRSS